MTRRKRRGPQREKHLYRFSAFEPLIFAIGGGLVLDSMTIATSWFAASRMVNPGVTPSLLADTTVHLPGA